MSGTGTARQIGWAAAAVAAALTFTGAAHGQSAGARPAAAGQAGPPVWCVDPGPPPPLVLRPPAVGPKPHLPDCIDPRTMMGRCRKPVLDRYNADVNAFNAQVQARAVAGSTYVDALNAWARATVAYANCEVTHMNAENPAD